MLDGEGSGMVDEVGTGAAVAYSLKRCVREGALRREARVRCRAAILSDMVWMGR
jgi:hypothetical protein